MWEWMYSSTFFWPWHYLEVSGQLHAPIALPPGKELWYPLDRRLDGSQSWSGRREKRNFLTLPGLELRPLDRPACSQSLYRLHYPGCRIKPLLILPSNNPLCPDYFVWMLKLDVSPSLERNLFFQISDRGWQRMPCYVHLFNIGHITNSNLTLEF
jgi:hypothetical protein